MTYNVIVSWKKNLEEVFVDSKYSRAHTWIFDGGIELAASSSPHVVPLPMSNESAVDPEEAFVASLSSCHMLWFLSIAAEKNYVVESYEDHAEGILGKNTDGQLAMTKVTLKPKVIFNNKTVPLREEVDTTSYGTREMFYCKFCENRNSRSTNLTTLGENSQSFVLEATDAERSARPRSKLGSSKFRQISFATSHPRN